MKYFIKLSLIIIILIHNTTIISQNKKWTLDECIKYALDNNLQVKQQEISLQLSKTNMMASKAALMPDLNANATHVYNYGRTIDMFTNDFATERVRSNNFYLSSSITLFNGFQLLNNVRKNIYDYEADKYNLEKIKNDISLSVATAYLQILYAKEYLKISEWQKQISFEQLERTKKFVEAGKLAKGDLLAAEAQYATDELNVINSHNQLDLAILVLVQILDLQDVENFDIVIPQININEDGSTLLISVENIYKEAIKVMPEISSAEMSVKSADAGLATSKGSYSPRLMLSASIGTGYSGASKSIKDYNFTGNFDTIAYTYEITPVPVVTPSYIVNYEVASFNRQVNDNFNKSIGLYLSIPLFNGFQARNNVSRSKLAVETARNNLQQAKNQLIKNIQQAKADATAALNKHNAAQKGLVAMKESYEYAKQKFDAGLLSIIEYNDARTKVSKTESELLQAKYEYIFRLKVLDFYLGKPIELQ